MLVLAGIVLMISKNQGLLAILALLATNAMLGWQFFTAARFWKSTVAEESNI